MQSKIQIFRAQSLRKYPPFRGQLRVRRSTAKHTASCYVHRDKMAKTELGGLVPSYVFNTAKIFFSSLLATLSVVRVVVFDGSAARF